MFNIMSKYQTQLTKDHWHRVVWNLRMLANTLLNFEEKEVGPYVNFLTSFGGHMCNLFMEK